MMDKKPTKHYLIGILILTGIIGFTLPALASNAPSPLDLIPTPVAPEPYPFSDRYPAVVYLATLDSFEALRSQDIDFEGLRTADGIPISMTDDFQPSLATIYISPEEAIQLENIGLNVIPIANEGLRSFYEFGPGSKAPDAWPTFEEFVTRMQSLEATYPTLVNLVSIGYSVQARDIWCLTISDNISVDENEPEFKYTSSMHGDETTGIEMTLRLAELLLQNYGVDPDLTELVNEIEIWLCPIHNPDGYVNGSRYNAHGIDLNREFPDRFTDPVDDPAGHEPENQAFMYLGYAQRFVMGANYHGGELVFNYPWDAVVPPYEPIIADYAPDDQLFHDLGLGYTTLNPMIYNGDFDEGLTRGWEWYQIWGGMQDWAYFWRGEHHVTIEVSISKMPSYQYMDTYWDNNRDAMLWWMKASLTGIRGRVLDAQDGSPLDASIVIEGMEFPNFARTDPDIGDYHRVIAPGIYTLIASASGYQSQSYTVDVTSGNATVHDFFLGPLTDLSGSIKNVSSPDALPGDILDYQIILLNNGTTTTVTLTDTLPTSLTLTGHLTATQGTPFFLNGQILWEDTLSQSVPVTITYSASVTQCLAAGTQLINTAEVKIPSEMSIFRSATVVINNQIPESPALLLPEDGSLSQPLEITLDWSASDDLNCDELSYAVYFGTTTPPPLFVSSVNDTSYSLTELSPHTTYYWSIQVSDAISTVQTPVWQFTTLNNPPDDLLTIYPLDGSQEVPTSLTFRWEASDLDGDALIYTLNYWEDGKEPIIVTGLDVTQYDPETLKPGVTYFWMISASDGFDTVDSNIWSFTTGPLRTYLPFARKTSDQEP